LSMARAICYGMAAGGASAREWRLRSRSAPFFFFFFFLPIGRKKVVRKVRKSARGMPSEAMECVAMAREAACYMCYAMAAMCGVLFSAARCVVRVTIWSENVRQQKVRHVPRRHAPPHQSRCLSLRNRMARYGSAHAAGACVREREQTGTRKVARGASEQKQATIAPLAYDRYVRCTAGVYGNSRQYVHARSVWARCGAVQGMVVQVGNRWVRVGGKNAVGHHAVPRWSEGRCGRAVNVARQPQSSSAQGSFAGRTCSFNTKDAAGRRHGRWGSGYRNRRSSQNTGRYVSR